MTELLRVFLSKKYRITITSLILALLYIGYAVFNAHFTQSAVISFIYPNSEKGLYPDGSRFNIYDILSDRVLLNTAKLYGEKTGQEIDTEAIRNHILVDDYLADSVQDRVTSARNQGQDYVYFTNEYVIKILPNRVFEISNYEKLFGLIPNVDNEILLDSLFASYKEFFMNEHTEMNIIPKITGTIDVDSYDYIEIADIYDKMVSMCIEYLRAKNKESETFRSPSTGLSFNDLISSLQSFRDVKISNLKSYVSSSRISKSPQDLINKLQTQIERDHLKYVKKLEEANIANQAMRDYDHTFEENIVIAGIDENIGLYQARPKTAYDTVTKRALEAGVLAGSYLKDIENNQWKISEYQNGPDPAERERLFNQADSLVKAIKEESQKLFESANITVDDYLRTKSNDYVRLTVSEKNYVSLRLFVNAGIIFVASMFLIDLYYFLTSRRKVENTKKINGKKAVGI